MRARSFLPAALIALTLVLGACGKEEEKPPVAPPEAAPPEAAPTEVAPTEAAPTEVAPTEVAPTEVAPTEVAPTEAAPTEAAPTEAAPTEAAPTEAAPTEAAPAPAPVSGDAAAGKAIYDNTCASCHGTGVAGAPKLGDKAAWGPRIAKGEAALMETVMKGKGAMPPRGACVNCSDADLRNAVAYMVQQAR